MDMSGPSGGAVGLSTRCMDDFAVSLVTKRSHLTPGMDFTAVQQVSCDEVFLTGAQGNLFSVDE